MFRKFENTKNNNIFLKKTKNNKDNYNKKNLFINEYDNDTDNENNININNDETFPELSHSHSHSHNIYKQNNNIDYRKAILQSNDNIKKNDDDIEPGWVLMYFDQNKKIVKKYGKSTGILEKINQEKFLNYIKDIKQFFYNREKEILQKIELFGDERLYKPELEYEDDSDIYYDNESENEDYSFNDELLDCVYEDYID